MVHLIKNASSGLLTIAVLLSVTGCANSYRTTSHDQVLQRAAFDLQCPADQIEVQTLQDERMIGALGGRLFTYGTSGCGQKAAYKVSCAASRCSEHKDS